MTASSLPLVQARHLSKSFNGVPVLRDIHWDIPAGRVIGLIGANGAGKSTLLRSLLGFTPVNGELAVLERSPRQTRNALMREVAFMADTAILPAWMSVAQLLDFLGGTHPGFQRQKAQVYLAQTQVTPQHKIRHLSKGMTVQLHLAIILSMDARLLVLDEPTLGLDILFRQQFYRSLIEDFLTEDRSIIIATHQIEEVEGLLTDIAVLANGRMVLNEALDPLMARFFEVRVAAEKVEEAMTAGPRQQWRELGGSRMLFERQDPTSLATLGQVQLASLTHIITTYMSTPGDAP